MGLIQIDLFTTLDGVAQAPGGPDEDTDGGFAFGGWQAPLADEVIGEQVGAGIAELDALLLGRKTYDIFAALLAAPDERDRPGLQQGAQVRRVTGQPDAGMGRLDAARARPRAGGARAARSSRERARHRQPRLRADAARRAALRRAHAVGLPDRARATGRRSSPAAPCRPTSPSSSRRAPRRRAR